MEPRTYYIPNNYLDSGSVLNGRFSTRNAVEAIILGLVGYYICESLPIPHGMDGITYYILICCPLMLLGAGGIAGDPLSVFFTDMYKWHKRKKPCFYNNNGRAYRISAAELLIDEPTMRDVFMDKLAQFRASMKSPAVEYVEGENYQFASDPELEALEAAEERRMREAGIVPEEKDEPEEEIIVISEDLNLDDIMTNIRLTDMSGGDRNG